MPTTAIASYVERSLRNLRDEANEIRQERQLEVLVDGHIAKVMKEAVLSRARDEK